jgi:hypothetical protein
MCTIIALKSELGTTTRKECQIASPFYRRLLSSQSSVLSPRRYGNKISSFHTACKLLTPAVVVAVRIRNVLKKGHEREIVVQYVL